MIIQKEFYFVRHGQTDHNLVEGTEKGDHPGEVSLNETGRNQAKAIEPVISSLPFQTVCSSPLKRAQETKEVITASLRVDHREVMDLGECSCQIWREMAQLGMYPPVPADGVVRCFMDQVRSGINQVLSLPGTSLVVAHGGVHWAICCWMGLEGYEWFIGNCVPVHFLIGDQGKWIAKKLV